MSPIRSIPVVLRCLAFAGAMLVAASAAAQEFPARPIRIIVPFPPGGMVDVVARLTAAKLPEALGQRNIPVLVENRPGASGTIGTEAAAKSKPDGYTLVMVLDTHAVNPLIYKTLPYDTFKDLVPVSLTVKVPLVVVATPSLQANSMQELVALAKSRPGSLSYASGGAGTAGHLAAEQFKFLTGVDIVHVPYKGGPPAIADLLSGQVHVTLLAISGLLSHIRSGKMKPLALVGPQRSPSLPNVPSTAEAGFPQLDTTTWSGVMAPAGTPPAIVSRLSREFANVLRDPEVHGKLTGSAMEVVGSTPEQFGSLIRHEYDKWVKLVKDASLNLSQ